MYYEEQWIEGALCWRTSPDGAWTRYTANELAHRYESAEKRAADAQATVEALQRVRDEARKRVDELEAREVDVVLLRDELDAEREKRTALLAEIDEGLTLSDNLLAIRTVTALYDELAQLQALVRALPVVRIDLSGAYRDTLLARPEDDAVKELLRYRVTLDATTPATMDAAETHDRMFNHADRHPEAL